MNGLPLYPKGEPDSSLQGLPAMLCHATLCPWYSVPGLDEDFDVDAPPCKFHVGCQDIDSPALMAPLACAAVPDFSES